MNLFVCAYNCYREDESCYEILGFYHVLIDATLGHIPYLSGSFRGGRFVQTVLIEDMSHRYKISGLHHVYVGCHTEAYPSNFAFIWIRCSDFICITFSSIAGQTFRLRLLHIRHSDFTFTSIRCSDLICTTFASTAG